MAGIIGVIVALAAINILSCRGLKLYQSVLAGIIVVAIFARIPPYEFVSLFYGSLTAPVSVNLALIVLSLTAFGNLLKETGNLRILVEKLALILKDRRHQVTVIPAVVGLLAFPGGAVFSAPMVEEAGAGLEMSRTDLAVSNVVFRHIFYLVFPFYSAMILLGELAGINVMYFARVNAPVIVLLLILSRFYLFRRVAAGKHGPADYREIPALLLSLSPLLLIITLAIGFGLYFPTAILAGIALALFLYLPRRQVAAALLERLLTLWRGANWSMMLSIVFILIFKDFLEKSGAVAALADLMATRGVPLVLLAVLLPYLSGFITGNHSASLGMSAPLFLAAVSDPALQLHYLVLIFITGLAGYVGSPLHLCTILTAEHFGVPLQQVIKKVNLMGACMSVLAVAYFYISIRLF